MRLTMKILRGMTTTKFDDEELEAGDDEVDDEELEDDDDKVDDEGLENGDDEVDDGAWG